MKALEMFADWEGHRGGSGVSEEAVEGREVGEV